MANGRLLFLIAIGFVVVSCDDKTKQHAKSEPEKPKTLKSFEEHKIVPEVIKVAPKELLKITYAKNLEVKEGNELTPTQVKAAPVVTWKADPKTLYTLIMTDPDAPSRSKPMFREWTHWLVGNIPGNDISKGDVLATYMAIGPPEGSGLHRYVFLLYKQNGKLNFTEPHLVNSCKDRAKFSVEKFVDKYSLGEPIAGNFYQGQYDSYSPILQKEIGITVTKEGNEMKYACN